MEAHRCIRQGSVRSGPEIIMRDANRRGILRTSSRQTSATTVFFSAPHPTAVKRSSPRKRTSKPPRMLIFFTWCAVYSRGASRFLVFYVVNGLSPKPIITDIGINLSRNRIP